MFADATITITGGTGSFGNAVLGMLRGAEVKEIRIFSRDEKKQDDMRHTYADDRIKYFIGDTRDSASLTPALCGADYVFHAAALKQVPSCEFYPLEAVKTNVLGAENVIQSAIRYGVKKTIVLSTDKAVYPVNAMGMSKALMEKVMIATSRTLPSAGPPLLCGTRYGNVMASRGSVIPLFIQQIKAGRAITVTDPTMTRFMMSLEDAVGLVLFAFERGGQGEVLVQKAPAATIGTLADALKDIFRSSVPVQTIGTRHGEKKHETLLNREELGRAEDLGDYYRVFPDDRDLNYRKYFEEGEQRLAEKEDYTSQNTRRLSRAELIDLLLKLPYVQSELRGAAQ